MTINTGNPHDRSNSSSGANNPPFDTNDPPVTPGDSPADPPTDTTGSVPNDDIPGVPRPFWSDKETQPMGAENKRDSAFAYVLGGTTLTMFGWLAAQGFQQTRIEDHPVLFVSTPLILGVMVLLVKLIKGKLKGIAKVFVGLTIVGLTIVLLWHYTAITIAVLLGALAFLGNITNIKQTSITRVFGIAVLTAAGVSATTYNLAPELDIKPMYLYSAAGVFWAGFFNLVVAAYASVNERRQKLARKVSLAMAIGGAIMLAVAAYHATSKGNQAGQTAQEFINHANEKLDEFDVHDVRFVQARPILIEVKKMTRDGKWEGLEDKARQFYLKTGDKPEELRLYFERTPFQMVWVGVRKPSSQLYGWQFAIAAVAAGLWLAALYALVVRRKQDQPFADWRQTT